MSTSRQKLRTSAPSRIGRRAGRWMLYSALVVATAMVLGTGGAYAYARRSLPVTMGDLKLDGLSQPTAVFRDEWGVPHIQAKSRHDLFLAQGYVTAQDRLWQMDLSRRAASGRLAEVFGASQVDTDKFLRSLMLRQAAEKSVDAYSTWARNDLQAFTDGVNAFIKHATESGRLPVEFAILGYNPEPWSPVDSAAIGKFMAYDLGGNFSGEVYRYQLRQKVGDDLAKQLWPVYPADAITILRTADAGDSQSRTAELPPDDSRIDLSDLVAAAPIHDEFVGSNNWVVSGKLTKTGKPLLANDPHLSVRTPAIWYQTHLVLNSDNETMDVIGVTFPGAPGIVVGHNQKVAWGVTNTNPDVQDLYIEKRNPQNPYQFEYMGKWEDAAVYKDPIKVKGKADVPFEVVVTRHGPIVSEVAGSTENRPKEALALKWTAHMPTRELEAVLSFDRSENWADFREALRLFAVPTQNFVFAALDGTIAYHAGGLVPIRRRGDGLVPAPGWTDEYEWREFIPFDKMPEVVNPQAGFVVTANNKVIDDAYPYFLTYSWAPPYRAARITEMLTGKNALTVDDFRQMQGDTINLQARALIPVLIPPLEKAALSETEKSALSLLRAWDFVDGPEQGAPLLFHTWWKDLTRMLYEPTMGRDLYGRMADKENVTDELLRNAARGQENAWLKSAGGLSRLATESFKAAVAEVVEMQGNNPAKWAWGKFHRLGPVHTIGGAVKLLGVLLNAKPLPVGGSGVTVRAMSFDKQTGLVTSGAVWRQTVDLADMAGNSFDIVTPGQSGHVLSRWYTDQTQMHVDARLHPQEMDPVIFGKGQKLLLHP